MTGMEPMVRWLIEAGQTVTLQGGGGHLTLVGLDRSPALGAEFEVTFIFERGGAITVRVPVTSAAADDAPASPEPAIGCAASRGSKRAPVTATGAVSRGYGRRRAISPRASSPSWC